MALAWALAWPEHGSILAQDWLPYAVVAAALVALVLATGTALRLDRAPLVALACLTGLAAWAGISALWSPVPTLARDESLLTALYVLAFAAPLLLLGSERERLAALGAVAGGLGALALADAVVLATTSDPANVELFGRLAYPIDYVNALATFFVVGIWPALVLASRRELHPALRALSFAAAAALACGFLLTQSKGSALGLAVSAIVVFAVAPGRLRLLVPTLGLVAVAVAGYEPLTRPYRASGTPAYLASVHESGKATILIVALGAVAGAAYAIADARIRLGPRAHRRAGAAALAALVLAVAAGIGGFLVREPHPVAFAQTKWHEFKTPPPENGAGSHFVTLAHSHRYDFWRVALRYGFEPHPLIGVGARGFGPLYLLHRRTSEFPRRAHSLEIEVLSEDGLVGFALLVAALGIPLVLAGRSVARPASAAALGGACCWLAQASVDWTWTLPAAGMPFFLLLGIGAARAGRPPLPSRVAWAGAAAAAAVAIFAFAPPWLSARFSAHGDYSLARRLDPLSTDPLVAEAYSVSPPLLAPLRLAAREQPRRVELHYQLGEALLAHGDRAAARRELREAVRLDPFDPVVRSALRSAR